ncbi:MAG: alpha/beta hydrolase [Candidatus Cyclobacteriaceae bacterium M3_2C_046]
MKNILLVVLFIISQHIEAQNIKQGTVIENLKFNSQAMNQEVGFSVYLPPDYETSNRRYPVLYLLHGYTDNETAWVQFGEVNYAADQGILTGEVTPMIIVMPDGGVTFYINDYQKKAPWEDMFIQEFMPYIEDNYKIRAEKQFRAIAGLSMGGYGSTILAMRHPDLFAACAPFSSAYRADEEILAMDQESYNRLYGQLFGRDLKGKERLTDNYYKYSALHLAKTLPEDQLKSVKWYIDCGDDDFLYKGNSLMHITLRERNIPHEYRVREGGHTWSYWRSGIKDALRFITNSFHR